MADQDDDQQTSDDQSGTQATESDPQTSQDQVTGQSAARTTDDQVGKQQTSDDQSQSQEDTRDERTGSADWRQRARRGLTLLQSDTSPDASRTTCMLNHILDDSHSDSYISDYFNVQQTAGGLPPDVSIEQFIAGVSTHIRENLATTSATSSFGEQGADSYFTQVR
jgi:hypothetical protein